MRMTASWSGSNDPTAYKSVARRCAQWRAPLGSSTEAPSRCRSCAKSPVAVHHRSAYSGLKRCETQAPLGRQAAKLCIAANLAGCGLQPRAQIIWSKQHFTLGRGDYHWKHETCWYAVRDGKTSHWQGDRTQTTVWEIANNNPFGNPQREQSWGHGTQKPVECMRRPIANNSRPGQAVYDPFLGLGTSLIAAEMTGRVCYGLELNPAYVDVIVRRWQLFTGRAATPPRSGQSF